MWTTTFVLTLLFFVIQLGTGFSMLAIASMKFVELCRITRAQLVVLGLTAGASTTGILLGMLSLLISDIRLQFAAIATLACIGLAWSWANWRPGADELRTAAIWFVLSLPIALLTWWWSFGAFSSYPYADIGADVHWMKNAQEYADSGVINPYAAQSYVDLRSALAGSLAGTFGLDLLRFSWTYRFFSILFVLLTSYAFVQGVYSTLSRRWIAFFFAATGNTVALMTNGSLAVASSIVFLGVLIGNTETKANVIAARSPLLLTGSAAAMLLVAFTINNNVLMLALLLAGLVLLRILSNRPSGAWPLFLGCIWPVVLLLAHRGSYLFVSTILASWLLYLGVVRIVSAGSRPGIAILRLLSFALPLIIVGTILCVAGMRFGYIPSISANETFSSITGLVLGRKIESGEELFLGSGPQIATIELGRSLGPLFPICLVLGVAWWWIGQHARRAPSIAIGPRAGGTTMLLWSWIAGCGLSVAILSGFPFLYRTSAIVVSLFTITATEIFCQLLVDPDTISRYRRTLVAVVATGLATVLVVAIYAFGWWPDLPFARYQSFLRPTEIAGIVLVATLVPLTLARSRMIAICSLVGVVGLAVAIDKAGLSGIQRSYSYGALPERATVISHYNANHLDAARWLRTHLRKGIFLSDPYTLGMIQAVTGGPAAYLFSNLDTVNEAVAQRTKTVLRAILNPTEGPQRLTTTCDLAASLLGEINSEASFQMRRADALSGLMRAVRDTQTPAQESPELTDEQARATIRNILGKDEDGWKLIVIITPRTIEWAQFAANERLNYFPPVAPIPSSVTDLLRTSPFPVLFTNEQTAVIRIPCVD